MTFLGISLAFDASLAEVMVYSDRPQAMAERLDAQASRHHMQCQDTLCRVRHFCIPLRFVVRLMRIRYLTQYSLMSCAAANSYGENGVSENQSLRHASEQW